MKNSHRIEPFLGELSELCNRHGITLYSCMQKEIAGVGYSGTFLYNRRNHGPGHYEKVDEGTGGFRVKWVPQDG